MGEEPLHLDEIMSQPPSEDINPHLTPEDRPLASPKTRSLEMSQYVNQDQQQHERPRSSQPTPIRRAPSVTVYAQREALKGAIGQQAGATTEKKSAGLLGRFLQMRQQKKVLVEGIPLGTKDSVFFAPDDYVMDGQQVRGTPTSFVNINPRLSKYTVHRGDAFEISFQGVSVSNSSFQFSPNQNVTPELLLYSLTRGNDPLAPGSELNHPVAVNQQNQNTNYAPPNNSAGSTLSNSNSNLTTSTINTNTTNNTNAANNNGNNNPNGNSNQNNNNNGIVPMTIENNQNMENMKNFPQIHPRSNSASVQSLPSQHYMFPTNNNLFANPMMANRNFSTHTQHHSLTQLLKQYNMAGGGIEHVQVPTGVSATSGDIPFIHYDPVVDGHDNGTDSDNYMPVPATKSLYLRCVGKRGGNNSTSVITNATTEGSIATTETVNDGATTNTLVANAQNQQQEEIQPQSVSIRFTIMEIDKVSDVQARAISGVDQLGNYVSNGAESVPYLELLTRAFAVASSLGNKGLKKYERPDHIHSVDMEFLLAERDELTGKTSEKGPNCGNYLQYGYYFFLSEKVDAKLYAQTCSSSQSIPLLLKREGFTRKMEQNNEKEYFPLNGISYLVAKVTRGCKHSDNENIPSLRMEHKRRLDNMLQMSHVIDMLAAMNGNPKISLHGARPVRR